MLPLCKGFLTDDLSFHTDTVHPRISFNLLQADAAPAQAVDAAPAQAAGALGDESEEEIEVKEKAASQTFTADI